MPAVPKHCELQPTDPPPICFPSWVWVAISSSSRKLTWPRTAAVTRHHGTRRFKGKCKIHEWACVCTDGKADRPVVFAHRVGIDSSSNPHIFQFTYITTALGHERGGGREPRRMNQASANKWRRVSECE